MFRAGFGRADRPRASPLFIALACSTAKGAASMKALLGSAAVVLTLLLFSDGGLAQGACAKACGDANARYQRACSDAGTACRRQAGGNPPVVAACRQRQQYCAGTYAKQYNLCLRSCRGR